MSKRFRKNPYETETKKAQSKATASNKETELPVFDDGKNNVAETCPGNSDAENLVSPCNNSGTADKNEDAESSKDSGTLAAKIAAGAMSTAKGETDTKKSEEETNSEIAASTGISIENVNRILALAKGSPPKPKKGGQKKLPVYAKAKPSVIPLTSTVKPRTKQETRQVVTIGLRCGATLLWIANLYGEPAFWWHILKDFRANMTMALEKYRVDRVVVRRFADKPTQIWEKKGKRDSDGNEKKQLWNMCLSLPNLEEDHEDFRAKWRTLFVKLFNHPSYRTRTPYGSNQYAYDAGDLTPRGENTELPFLSDYLTIKHTVDVMEYGFGSSGKSRQELVDDDNLLQYYFPKKQFETVRECVKSYAQYNENYSMPTEPVPDITFDSI